MNEEQGWIGVDLDRTIARYESGDYHKYGAYHIGEPIQVMVERVKGWLAEGKDVRIMTARVKAHVEELEAEEDFKIRKAIWEWCKLHIGQILQVTSEKDFEMIELWDDRAIQVIPNTGQPVEDALTVLLEVRKILQVPEAASIVSYARLRMQEITAQNTEEK